MSVAMSVTHENTAEYASTSVTGVGMLRCHAPLKPSRIHEKGHQPLPTGELLVGVDSAVSDFSIGTGVSVRTNGSGPERFSVIMPAIPK